MLADVVVFLACIAFFGCVVFFAIKEGYKKKKKTSKTILSK
jgi:hypothetical protein